MNATAWLVKAERAAASAKLLLEAGDLEGACNRAYYAMFDAARAALMATGAPAEAQNAKTHNGLIAAFSRCLVKTGQVSVELGRTFNQAEEIRLVSDYTGNPIGPEQALWVVEQATLFVQTIQTKFLTIGP
jgi:uncharacterized protein (UPF0332 family)